MIMPPAVVMIEIKRTCGYSQVLQEALQFLSLKFPYSPLPLALLLLQALAVPYKVRKCAQQTPKVR